MGTRFLDLLWYMLIYLPEDSCDAVVEQWCCWRVTLRFDEVVAHMKSHTVQTQSSCECPFHE